MLGTFCPHLAEELWAGLGHSPSLLDVGWPGFDPRLCIDDVIEMPIQVNGKVRGKIRIARDSSEEEARNAALSDGNVQKHIEGKSVRKVVYVPGRILNVIVG